jgi:hypothetical protein
MVTRALLPCMLTLCMLLGCQSTGSPGESRPDFASGWAADPTQATETVPQEDLLAAADRFFGHGALGLAEVLDRVLADHGEPTAYITGTEGGGALLVGLRYGQGTLHHASGMTRRVFWKGPSLGLDVGGDAAKVFVLVYGLHDVEQIYRRYPGVAGSVYFVGGVGVNYHATDGITLAPVRAGVGWRLGMSVGYLHVHRSRDAFPL